MTLPVLRFVTCGSVDDGKSTLLGRLLYDTGEIYDDQLASTYADSVRYGTQGNALDLALTVDGLRAEREQRITIDVAHRYFSTPRRRFIALDAPGHEQYTRNMVTGASTADLAVVLADARKGLVEQARRHTHILHLLGVRHIVLAVNKMDLVNWSRNAFEEICTDYSRFVSEFRFVVVRMIPLCALTGENVGQPGASSTWYDGPTLLSVLESANATSDDVSGPCLQIQWVNRPDMFFRGYSGRISGGTLRVNDAVTVLPRNTETRIRTIRSCDGEVSEAGPGRSVTVTLDDEVDATRGDVLATRNASSAVGDRVMANVVWFSERPLVAGQPYACRIHTADTSATVTSIRHRIDIDTSGHLMATRLNMNDVAVVEMDLGRALPVSLYEQSKRMGAFILIDTLSNDTVGAGMITSVLHRAPNVQWQRLTIGKAHRSRLMAQRPMCIWLTGLPGAGKSTIAGLLERKLFEDGRHTYVLDGDNVRYGLTSDLGFSASDRSENVRRVSEAARLMVDAGLIVVVSTVSPFAADRARARALFEPGEFFEVFVDTPLEECRRRDPKGVYAKASRKQIANLTGVDDVYEVPVSPELVIKTEGFSPNECVDLVKECIELRQGG